MIHNLDMNNHIIIYCAGDYGEEIFLKLVAMGYCIDAFCDNAKSNIDVVLWGKPVYNYEVCRKKYPKAVYVVANSHCVTELEIGEILEQDGYIKNLSYFLSNEFVMHELSSSLKEGIRLVSEDRIFIVYGDLLLCHTFKEWIQVVATNVMVHICSSENEIDYYKKKYSTAIWIPLGKWHPTENNWKEFLIQLLQKHTIFSFSRLFLNHMLYCEEIVSPKESRLYEYKTNVEKIVFLKESALSGSMLIDSILDSHPNILYLNLSTWSVNIWYIIKYLIHSSQKELVEMIVSQIIEHESQIENGYEKVMAWIDDYRKILRRYIDKETYTERELFLIIYMAYYELLHGSIPQGEMIIYMDIHSNMVMRDSVFSWLEKMGFEIILLEMVRNPYKRLGSVIKFTRGECNGMLPLNFVPNILHHYFGETINKAECKYPIIRIRFEDLKIYPRKVLEELCNRLGIPWSDSLLKTTLGGKKSTYISNGEKITGFDIKPVYYSYDEYFDAFDKFRLDLIFREKSKAYGYSYVERDKYPLSLEELGILFGLPFCFEKFVLFKDEEERMKFRKKMRLLCTQLLYFEGDKNKYIEHFRFGEYLLVNGR